MFLFCGYIPHKYKHKTLFLDFYFPVLFWSCEVFPCDLDQWCTAEDSKTFSPSVWVHRKPQTCLQWEFSPAATHRRVLRGCWSEALKGSSALSLCIFQNQHGQMKWVREDYLFFLLSLGYLLDFHQHFEVVPEVALVKRIGTSAVPHAHDLTHLMCRVTLAKCHIYRLVAIDVLFRVTQFVGAEQKKK